MKHVDIDINDIVVVLPRDFDKISITIGGRIEYQDENFGIGPEPNGEPRNMAINLTVGAAIESRTRNFYSQILDPTSFLLKGNLEAKQKPLISVSTKNTLTLRLTQESIALCLDVCKAQLGRVYACEVKHILIEFSALKSISKEFAMESNVLLNFPNIELLLPKFEMIIAECSMNKCDRTSCTFEIDSIQTLSSLIRISDVRVKLIQGSEKIAGIVKVNTACLCVDELQNMVNIDVVHEQGLSIILKSFQADTEIRTFKSLMATIGVRCIIVEGDDNPIMEIPLQINNVSVDITKTLRHVSSIMVSKTKQLNSIQKSELWSELKNHIQNMKLNVTTVLNEVSSDMIRKDKAIAELQQQESYLEVQKLTNLLFLSNDHSGYLQVGVNYAEYLQRFFCIIRRGVLYLYKVSRLKKASLSTKY